MPWDTCLVMIRIWNSLTDLICNFLCRNNTPNNTVLNDKHQNISVTVRTIDDSLFYQHLITVDLCLNSYYIKKYKLINFLWLLFSRSNKRTSCFETTIYSVLEMGWLNVVNLHTQKCKIQNIIRKYLDHRCFLSHYYTNNTSTFIVEHCAFL